MPVSGVEQNRLRIDRHDLGYDQGFRDQIAK